MCRGTRHRIAMGIQSALCVCILIATSFAVEVRENSTEVTELIMVNGNLTVSDNVTVVKENKPDMQRITQPSARVPYYAAKNETKRQSFSPSPQLQSYIEFNRLLVPPAVPESKHIRFNSYVAPPSGRQYAPAEQKSNENFSPAKYYDRLNFGPPQYPPFFTSTAEPATAAPGSRPPPYLPPEKPSKTEVDLSTIKFYDGDNPEASPNQLYSTSSLELYNKGYVPGKSQIIPVADHPYPFMFGNDHRDEVHKVHSGEEYAAARPRMPPWKKALKLLATFVPIGLLLSAFVPNILTVGPVNNSTVKLEGRAEGIEDTDWREPECETKLLCELSLLSDEASAEKSRKLFWKLMNQNGRDAYIAAQLEAVSNAIKRRRCDGVTCGHAHATGNVRADD